MTWYKQTWVRYSVAAVGAAAVIVLLVSGTSYKQQQLCTGVIVNIAAVEGKVFVDDEDVKNLLKGLHNNKLEGLPVHAFKLREAERQLMQDVWIHNAQLYFNRNGVLYVHISERYPVARVFDVGGNSYYLDSSALKLPLSNTDRADVPVFTGIMTHTKSNDSALQSQLQQVVRVAEAIGTDEFWLAQAAQIHVESKDAYTMYPTVGSHVVDLGSANDMEDKLHRLKVFYKQVYGKDAFVQYSRLSVAYKGQLVAQTGADTLRQRIDPQRAVQVFEKLVRENKTETNATAVEAPATTTGRIMAEVQPEPIAEKRQAPKASSKPDNDTLRAVMPKPKALMPAKNSNN